MSELNEAVLLELVRVLKENTQEIIDGVASGTMRREESLDTLNHVIARLRAAKNEVEAAKHGLLDTIIQFCEESKERITLPEFGKYN